MSFRRYVYYCALFGGWAALFGWLLGRLFAPRAELERTLGHDAVMGCCVGLMTALGLSLVDSAWTLGMRQFGRVGVRLLMGILVGAVGGLVGGLLSHWLGRMAGILFALGWIFAGLLVGISVGAFELLASAITKRETQSARRKFVQCMIGGTIGGLLGGLLFWLFRSLLEGMLRSKNQFWLWTPNALGFVLLGACIGLMVGFMQVWRRGAWIRVEAGARAGNDLILSRENTVIGRDGSDLALHGDGGVDRTHAAIMKVGDQFFIEDRNSSAGTFVNDQMLRGRLPLRSGDMIRVGGSVLRFHERQRR